VVIATFSFSKIPHIYFGTGTFDRTGSLAQQFGNKTLIVTGSSSFQKSGKQDLLHRDLTEKKITYASVPVAHEPSPELIDRIVAEFRSQDINVVIAVGGGSVLDTGKAISAMLVTEGSVTDYLEGVGSKTPPGEKIPFIAIPTTAGTGSETTKNAVISQVGDQGFKKSLRHDNYIPDIAIIDPGLALGAPAHVTAHCGMDAFAQLLESYLSSNASPMTDALALSGIQHIKKALIAVATTEPDNLDKRSAMAYAAMLSGITLANAGLGIVHGIAGPLGGFFNIPHGAACGALLHEAMCLTVEKMREDEQHYKPYLEKCALIGGILTDNHHMEMHAGCNALLSTLEEWGTKLSLSKMSTYGVTMKDVDTIARASSNKNNPVRLNHDDISQIVANCV
jgi:alcohol dehydrogenase class IV